MNIIDWITKHWMEIVAIIGGIVIAARVIVKLTPAPKDDTVLQSLVDFLKHLGLVIESPPEEPTTPETPDKKPPTTP